MTWCSSCTAFVTLTPKRSTRMMSGTVEVLGDRVGDGTCCFGMVRTDGDPAMS